MIYLDHNATTQPAPEVVAKLREALEVHWHNPSSVHRAGQQARRVMELARQSIAELIGCKPRELTFTSGGTESIALAIRGTLLIAPPQRRVILTSPVEHHAVDDTCQDLVRRGQAELRLVPVDGEGRIRLDEFARLLGDDVALVSIQWANNETGTIQPVHEVARLCLARGVRFHCDATQWVGKMPTRVGSPDSDEPAGSEPPLDCDLLTFSSHKIHGPKGVAVLYARAGTKLPSLIQGTQERGRRGGTENVPGIVGFGEAARLAKAWLEVDAHTELPRLAALRDRFEQAVLALVPEASVNGPASGDPHARLWNTTNIAFPRLGAEAILLSLSERGVYASAGAACSSGSLEPSPVILAMGVPPDRAYGSVRFSICRHTTQAELDQAAVIVGECITRLRKSLPA